MNKKSIKLATIGIFVINLFISQNVFSFSAGINGYSTNPATNGGNSCVACHSGGTAPVVDVTGPTSVQPGSISTYTLTISGGQQNSGGFDVSADAGTLMSILANTKLQAGELTHNQRVTAAGDGTVSWDFNWQAPTTAGTYTIYSAGLSTNGDSSTTGDEVDSVAYTVDVSAGAAQAPTAVITAPLTAQANATVSFDGSASFDPDGVINQYDWDFGDGNTATGAQAINTFTTAGVYTVQLTVTDSDNLTHSTFQDITVGGILRPNADPGGPYTGTEGQPVNFDGSLSTHVSPITNYIWDFGDGTPVMNDSIATISHTYATPGAYTVTLAVQDANNITGVASTTVVIDAVLPPPPPPELDGPTLYNDNCMACHGALDSSSKLNRTAAQIQGAIDANTGGMGGLSGLSPTQVQAIADALVSVTPPPPPPTDGQSLYANNCAACHGPLETSTKLNRSATQIQAAIDANTGGMGGLNVLTPTQVQAISDALVSVTPPPEPTTGEGLYNSYCLVCHGPGGTGGQYEAVTGDSANSIADAIIEEPLMSTISLSSAQLEAIADYLNGVTPPPPPTTGQQLYNNYCLACHGPGGTGGVYEAVNGSSANEIADAIDEESMMNSISLNSSQLEDIADYLSGEGGGGGTPAPAPTDGATLYGNNCSGCHGALASSSKLNRTAAQIQSAIDTNTGGMGGLSSLTPTNVQAIADALATGGGTPPPPPTPVDGATLYTNNCSGCHGALANSTKLNRTASQIQAAIDANIGGMGGLNTLTTTEVQAIADALAGGGTTPVPTTGEELYITYCQSCHGFNGTGGSGGAVVGVSSSLINSALSSVGQMQGITLSGTDVQAIADFLSSGGGSQPQPTTGEEIYAIKCAACHGPGGTGGSEEAVTGASLSEILDAMLDVSEMRPIPLTNGEAQALENYLNGNDGHDGGDHGDGHGDD